MPPAGGQNAALRKLSETTALSSTVDPATPTKGIDVVCLIDPEAAKAHFSCP